jgi:UDP-3-O-[3-hydroxymyristoyl] glucosamine N-acyltransferase
MDLKSLMKKYGVPESIEGTCSMENISNGKLTFISDMHYKKFLKPNQNASIFTSQKIFHQIKGIRGNKYIVVENPHLEFIEFHNCMHKNFIPFNTGDEKPESGRDCSIDNTAKFGKNVKLGKNVRIGPYVVIGKDVTIGNNTSIYASVNIYDGTFIGNDCVIDSGASIGGEGFSTIINNNNQAARLINIGTVHIGNNVEIGCSVTIDRASFTETRIGDRVKIDNLTHVAHNVVIGQDTRIASLVSMGGGCNIGKRVWISLGCTISHHTTIGDDCKLMLNSVVAGKVEDKSEIGGFYAIPNKSWLKYTKDIYKKYLLK